MEKSYSFKTIENKWQKKWSEKSTFKYDKHSNKTKYYVLEMFPYPSGKMHMGHVRNYTLGDVLARYKKNKNYNVLHPMGWDAFGLPAENAAKENNTHPAKWTYENIEYMKSQFIKLGFSVDWSVEIITCSPEYYKIEQAIFIDFYKAGLAYKKESWVNWDPIENTVLANEQVIAGRGWRSGALIEQKQLNQWFLKITDFAEDLLNDLSLLKDWPEKVKSMQQNWIGKSYGANIFFNIKNTDEKITVYSTRPETLFGATFIGLSIHHPKAIELSEKNPLIAEFIKETQQTGTIEENINKEEKKGIDTGLIALNPLNGEEIKIFICNYVLDYGTACIFGCPAHDGRDFEFAKKYNLPIKKVVKPLEKGIEENELSTELSEENGIMINSEFLNGLTTEEAIEKAISHLETKNLGEKKTNYRLKDWGVSRQRYWGCPIPIIYCNTCGVVPEKKENLPITLPDDVDFNKSGNPLVNHPTWKHTNCPKCGGVATRETDTFDTFFESSWYFLRYPTVLEDNPFEKNAINYWLPVDQYIGGVEHAVMHLLYARFFVKALAKLNILGEKNKNLKEPFKALMTQGMISHKTYKDKNGKWLYPTEIIFNENNQPIHFESKLPVTIGKSEKMSKSKKNTVDPDYICQIYGADTARMFVLSDSPPDKDLEWTDEGVEGIYKFINKYWRLAQLVLQNSSLDITKLQEKELEVYSKIQKYIVEIENNINDLHLNKAVALNRELFNLLDSQKEKISPALLRYGVEILTQTLNPFIPHVTEEIWEILGNNNLLSNTLWPTANSKYLTSNKITIAVQISGKTKGSVEVDADITQENILIAIKDIPSVNKLLDGAMIKKVIYVPKRIINVLI